MTATATWSEHVPHPARAAVPAARGDIDVCTAEEVAEYVVRLTRTLAALPSPDALLQALVLGLPARLGVCSAVLAGSETPGLTTTWYGLPGLGDPEEPARMADDGLVQHAMSAVEPQVWARHDQLPARPSRLAALPVETRPCAAARLERLGVPVGALVLGTDRDIDVDDADQLRRLVDVTAALVGAHLGLLAQVPAARSAQPRPSSADDVRLTRRQLAVLGLMAEGMSNRQIALRVGYSESTVRHETMAIYRALGVGNRRAASLLALELGLIG